MKKLINGGFLLATVLGTTLQFSNSTLPHSKINNLENVGSD